MVKKAADKGNTEAQKDIGRMFLDGEGVTQDYAEAHKWFRKAAEQGDAEAQFHVGTNYYIGLVGLPRDYAEALKWYLKAADQGDAAAQIASGDLYSSGQGVTQDYAEALKWYQKAAEQGDKGAQDKIREIKSRQLSDKGKGVAQDRAPLSLNDTGAAWKAASESERIALCRTMVYGTGLTNDYKYWYYNIDRIYDAPDLRWYPINLVIKDIESANLVNEKIKERQKYLDR